jgi:hypothetical protein
MRNRKQLTDEERARRRARDRERLREAAEQLLSSEGWRRWVRARASHGLARYSLTNQLLVALQSEGRATFAAGFKQWLALGYCVRKGERALRVMAPMTVKERDRETGEETGETITLFKSVPVFFQEQVEPLPSGEPVSLEPPREPLTGDSHARLLPRLRAFCESLGYSVSFEPIDGPAGGWCDPSAKRIVVDGQAPANAQLRTLVHEVAHALGVDYERYSREQSEVLADTVVFWPVGSIRGLGAGRSVGDGCHRRWPSGSSASCVAIVRSSMSRSSRTTGTSTVRAVRKRTTPPSVSSSRMVPSRVVSRTECTFSAARTWPPA